MTLRRVNNCQDPLQSDLELNFELNKQSLMSRFWCVRTKTVTLRSRTMVADKELLTFWRNAHENARKRFQISAGIQRYSISARPYQ